MHPLVATRAVGQHGVVGRRQLLAGGIPERTVGAWVARGHLSRVSRAVYRVPGAPLTPLAELMAATLRCGPSARAAGERLLAHLGVHGADPTGPFVVLTQPGRVVTGVPWRWRTDAWPARDDATIVGVPSVTPARSLVEAVVDCSDDDLERLVDGCRWRGRLLPAVRRLVRDLPQHPGTARLLGSGLLDMAAGESPPERRAAEVLVPLGAAQQVWLTSSIRVDFLFPEARLVVEYDGRATHEGPVRRGRDSGRDDALRALGYAVLRITARDLADPAGLRRRIVALLETLTP